MGALLRGFVTSRRGVAGGAHSGGDAQPRQHPLHDREVGDHGQDDLDPFGHSVSIDAPAADLVTKLPCQPNLYTASASGTPRTSILLRSADPRPSRSASS